MKDTCFTIWQKRNLVMKTKMEMEIHFEPMTLGCLSHSSGGVY